MKRQRVVKTRQEVGYLLEFGAAASGVKGGRNLTFA